MIWSIMRPDHDLVEHAAQAGAFGGKRMLKTAPFAERHVRMIAQDFGCGPDDGHGRSYVVLGV